MTDRKVFHDSITALPAQLGLAPQGLLVQSSKDAHRQESMSVLFSLALPASSKAALEAKVEKGETVTASELQGFAPKESDLTALATWLTTNGYTDVELSKDRSGVYAHATVEKIETSLQVNVVRVTKDGLTYNAVQNAPSLPSDVGAPVQAIVGLQPFRSAHKHSRIRLSTNGNRSALGKTEAKTAATNLENTPPYLVHEILKAYNADGLPVTGKGQTIAILIDTFPHDDDVKTFWAKNNLPTNIERIQKINVKGGHLPPPSGEETLDVEWASGIARDATVKVYASGSLTFVALDKALDRILADAMVDPTLRQVSISLGLGETFLGGPNGEMSTQHQKFLKLAAFGVNVFVSSGDAGSNPDSSGHGSGGPLQVEYESSDPCVIGVGGTTLNLAANGGIAGETGWAGGGGGKSAFFARPSWQKGASLPHGTKRLVPDVSLAADPETGAFLVMQGKVQQIGGTSWSAPVWAAFCALINEARVKAGKKTIGFMNPLIYPLKGTTECFRDVTDGTNGAYESGPGYDMVTGLGVPHIANLVKELSK